jgi:hypothetical protein
MTQVKILTACWPMYTVGTLACPMAWIYSGMKTEKNPVDRGKKPLIFLSNRYFLTLKTPRFAQARAEKKGSFQFQKSIKTIEIFS